MLPCVPDSFAIFLVEDYHHLAMSLLQQNPTVPDEAAAGEELTKGSSHLIWTTIIAAVVVSIAIAIYVIAGQKPPAAAGEVVSASAHYMHSETSGFDASGAAMPKEELNQVMLFTHVKLHNQSKQPLFLHQIMANITLSDGIHSSYAATPTDYERLFKAYKELAPMHGKSLGIEETIAPGDTLEGDFVSAFRMSKEDWQSRKGVDYSVSFRYQPDLKLTPTNPVAEQ
jgi:hypothetical protein